MFINQFDDKLHIPKDAQVIFVSDFFANDLIGGAELTTEALIESSPYKVFKLRSRLVTMELLKEGFDRYWIFGNWATMRPELIPSIAANLKYSILEYDYKFCQYRSPEKHESDTGTPCDCHDQITGKVTSAFYLGAKNIWWMSEMQQKRYLDRFPFLAEKSQMVLSSVFSELFWHEIRILRDKFKDHERKGWAVLGSGSWIKGTEDAIEWCKQQGHEYKVLSGLSPSDMLEELAKSEGFVYLPKGGDTCPRVVIEAKLLGCKLHLNDFVEHKDEIWFDTDDQLETESYLYAARETFWNATTVSMQYTPKVSGYTTTRNCIRQGYPWEESIASLLGFCDEVAVVDGGSDDGTWEKLLNLAETEPRLKIKQVILDWEAKRFALNDGILKAEARSLCTSEFCWQQDVDEVVHEDDYEKVKRLIGNFPAHSDLIALPVIEFWGSTDKIRVDINPWKWRLSRNNPRITHGVPKDHRVYDENGELYSRGSDGCCYIDRVTHERVPFVTFMDPDAERARIEASRGDRQILEAYSIWMNQVAENVPGVYHYSWFDIERKIHTYKNYWSKHWDSLYNVPQEDTPENNKFFDKKWADVSGLEIKDLAKKLSTEMGGWIFHNRVNFEQPTPWIKIERSQPKIMEGWTKTHGA